MIPSLYFLSIFCIIYIYFLLDISDEGLGASAAYLALPKTLYELAGRIYFTFTKSPRIFLFFFLIAILMFHFSFYNHLANRGFLLIRFVSLKKNNRKPR